MRNATRMLLKGEGYSVAAVATLAEALQQGTEEPSLDVLLTDYHLRDGETGMQVISSLRGAPVGSVAGRTGHRRHLHGDARVANRPLPAYREQADETSGTLQAALRTAQRKTGSSRAFLRRPARLHSRGASPRAQEFHSHQPRAQALGV